MWHIFKILEIPNKGRVSKFQIKGVFQDHYVFKKANYFFAINVDTKMRKKCSFKLEY